MIVCPRCEGQLYDVGACGTCRSVGYLDDRGHALYHAQIVQIAATAALAAGLQLAALGEPGSDPGIPEQSP